MSDDDEYPDLGYGNNDVSDNFKSGSDFISKKLIKSSIRLSNEDQNEAIRSGIIHSFEAFPPIAHFSQWSAGQSCTQLISVTNCSKRSLRFQIYPPSSTEFVLEYDKIGSLAPGMSQTIAVKFTALEYRYYYDCIRIQGEDSTLLIPLHGYPIANKVYFPKQLFFGSVPLCEPAVKTITLSCSLPINFSFEIKVLESHSFYNIEPRRGIIPANGSIEIRITFTPITLGIALTKIQLLIGQFAFIPLDCEVSARAVSGLIESRDLLKAEKRVLEYLFKTSYTVRGVSGGTLGGTVNTVNETKTTRSLNRDGDKNNIYGAKTLDRGREEDKNNMGTKTLDSIFRETLPLPGLKQSGSGVGSGLGSGLVFDSGATWLAAQNTRKFKKKLGQSLGTTIKEPQTVEKVVAGYRMPTALDTVQSITYVLTQEAGKLKPKDLKVAIDRNRAEREARLEEQEKLREQGGGMGLDLNGILAEERLYTGVSDPFRRQLREMAFLADVDDVRKQEAEKEFRANEEYLGSSLLTEEDMEEILHQRKLLGLREKRAGWRTAQNRQHTIAFPPSHATVKAGASASVVTQAMASLTPSFDPNRNDIWAKRMNTLRYFISAVSRWIVRRRAGLRLAKIKAKLAAVTASLNLDGTNIVNNLTAGMNGMTISPTGTLGKGKTKERAKKDLVRAWIDSENISHKVKAPESTGSSSSGSGGTNLQGNGMAQSNTHFSFDQCTTVAELVCATDNEAIMRRKLSEHTTSSEHFELSSQVTVQRLLFPKCVIEEGSTHQSLPTQGIEKAVRFDDRTFFQLKVRPDHVNMRYNPHKIPGVPIFYPTGKDKAIRIGAPEECSLRPPADSAVTIETMLGNLNPELPAIAAIRIAAQASQSTYNTISNTISNSDNSAPNHTSHSTITPASSSSSLSHAQPSDTEASLSAPSWLLTPTTAEGDWNTKDLDFFRPRSDLRTYSTAPTIKETDPDWILRPYAYSKEDSLVYEEDNSVKSSWLATPGFSSANAYVLGGLESRCLDPTSLSFPGPTLSDFYMPDLDRHRSGMFSFANDHMRTLTGADPDFLPLQHRQSKKDCLTDSESDEEDKYVAPKPSMKRVRALLKGVKKIDPEINTIGERKKSVKGKDLKGSGKEEVKVIVPEDVIPIDSGEESDEDKKGHQVELLRDRKTLELESLLLKARRERETKHANRLTVLSRSSQCLLHAIPVQLPFHHYETEAYNAFSTKIDTISDIYVEPSHL